MLKYINYYNTNLYQHNHNKARRAINTITANLRILAESPPSDEVDGSASGTDSPSQVIVVEFQTGVSPEQEQFGATLPVPKQAVQDLSQLDEQVIQPSVQAEQASPV